MITTEYLAHQMVWNYDTKETIAETFDRVIVNKGREYDNNL